MLAFLGSFRGYASIVLTHVLYCIGELSMTDDNGDTDDDDDNDDDDDDDDNNT